MSSRLSYDARGQLVVVVTTASPGLPTGTTFRVLGDSISTGATPATSAGYYYYYFTGTSTGAELRYAPSAPAA